MWIHVGTILRANVNLQGCQNKKHGEVDLDDEIGELISKHCRRQTAEFEFLAMIKILELS